MAKRERPGIKSNLSSDSKQENLLAQLKEKSKPKASKRKIRFTMDLPEHIHAAISEKADHNGQTMKGYIMSVVRADLSN